GLAADRGVDLRHEARRDGGPRDPAEVCRRGEAGGVGGAAAPERDDRAAADEPELLPEPLDGRDRLRLLAVRKLVRLAETTAERVVAATWRDAGAPRRWRRGASGPTRRSFSSSRSTSGRPRRRATSAASVVLPAPMEPTSAT